MKLFKKIRSLSKKTKIILLIVWIVFFIGLYSLTQKLTFYSRSAKLTPEIEAQLPPTLETSQKTVVQNDTIEKTKPDSTEIKTAVLSQIKKEETNTASQKAANPDWNFRHPLHWEVLEETPTHLSLKHIRKDAMFTIMKKERKDNLSIKQEVHYLAGLLIQSELKKFPNVKHLNGGYEIFPVADTIIYNQVIVSEFPKELGKLSTRRDIMFFIKNDQLYAVVIQSLMENFDSVFIDIAMMIENYIYSLSE